MSKREFIARYTLIINKLRKQSATFDEIADYLALESELQEYNFNVSKRTFQRDLKDISSLYNIDIQYDFSRKVYFIDYDEQTEVNERMFEAFDTFNALNLSDRLSDQIHFENRRPQGTENLHGLLHAVKNSFQIKFIYQKFWEDDPSKRIVEPYAIKEFNNRWYILANDKKDLQVKSFALDRLSDLDITKIKFKLPENFDLNEHYKYCFGIVSPNSLNPKEVILSFNPIQGKYIKSLPLHHSQEILIDNNNELRIRLKLFTTHDFFMELLSFGDAMKVIKPSNLAKDIQKTYKRALKQYE